MVMGQCLSYKPVGGWSWPRTGPGLWEESQLVWGRHRGVRPGTWPELSRMIFISTPEITAAIKPCPWAADHHHHQDDHLQLQWPPQLSSSPSPAPSFSSASLLLWAPKPKVIRARLVAFSDFSGFQINLPPSWQSLLHQTGTHLAYLWCLAMTSSSIEFKWISHINLPGKYNSSIRWFSLCASETNKKR